MRWIVLFFLGLALAGLGLFEAFNYDAWRGHHDVRMDVGLWENGGKLRSGAHADRGKTTFHQYIDIDADTVTAGPVSKILDASKEQTMTDDACPCGPPLEFSHSHIEVLSSGEDMAAKTLVLYASPLALRSEYMPAFNREDAGQLSKTLESYLRGGHVRFHGQFIDESLPLDDLRTSPLGEMTKNVPELVPVGIQWLSPTKAGPPLVEAFEQESEVNADLYDAQDRLIVSLTFPTRNLSGDYKCLATMTNQVSQDGVVEPFYPWLNYIGMPEPKPRPSLCKYSPTAP